MEQEQLRSLHQIGRALGHEWACTLSEERALELGSPEAIRHEIEKADIPHGITYPSSGHRTPSRASYDVGAHGHVSIEVTRPKPGGGAYSPVSFKYIPGEYHEIWWKTSEQEPFAVSRSWHLHFLADVLKYLCPKASGEARARAFLLEEEEGLTRREEDRVAFARAEIDIAIHRHVAAIKTLDEAETRVRERQQFAQPTPIMPPLSAPVPPWLQERGL